MNNHSITTHVHAIAQELIPVYSNHEEREQIAWWLIEFVTGVDRTALIAHPDKHLSPQEIERLGQLVVQHVQLHKPLQYILGSVPFAGVDITMYPPIHIPRPETEEWTMHLITQLQQLRHQALNILDMCTGSGCIAVACAYHLPHARIVGADSSSEALVCAQRNAEQNHITNVSWYQTDLFVGLPESEKFHCIVSNPPYISHAEWQGLELDVRLWEDPAALMAHDNGYAIIYKLIDQAPAWLADHHEMKEKKIPQLVLEMSDHQTDTVAAYLAQAGWYDVTIQRDYAHLQRTVTARLT